MKTILKILRYISAGIGYLFLWFATFALYDGLTRDLDMIGVVIIMFLPLGFLFRWLSISGKTRKQKCLNIIENFLVLLTIRGSIATTSYLLLPIYVIDFLIVGVVFIIAGILGLRTMGRNPFDRLLKKENVK